MLGKYSTRLIFCCLLAVLGVFVGVDMASKGVERINGPITAANQSYRAKSVHTSTIHSGLQGKAANDTDQEKPDPSTDQRQNKAGQGRQKHAPGQLQGQLPGAAATKLEDQPYREPFFEKAAGKIGEALQWVAAGSVKAVVSVFEHLLN